MGKVDLRAGTWTRHLNLVEFTLGDQLADQLGSLVPADIPGLAGFKESALLHRPGRRDRQQDLACLRGADFLATGLA